MNIKKYDLIFTPTAIKEINKIYNYISENLSAKNSAKRLMTKIEQKVQELKYSPQIYQVIEIDKKLKLNYRKIVINYYIVLYTINENKKTVYIAHVYYASSNYLNKI